MRNRLNAGATSEITRIWKIHTIHSPIHSNKANMKWWLWRPNDILGPGGPKASWHLSYRWGRISKKPHPGNLSRPGIEPGFPCGTGAHATACPTAVDTPYMHNVKVGSTYDGIIILIGLYCISDQISVLCLRLVFHCKLRHQGSSSSQRQVFQRKLRNQGCSFNRNEWVR